jgi:hypothetical protein
MRRWARRPRPGPPGPPRTLRASRGIPPVRISPSPVVAGWVGCTTEPWGFSGDRPRLGGTPVEGRDRRRRVPRDRLWSRPSTALPRLEWKARPPCGFGLFGLGIDRFAWSPGEILVGPPTSRTYVQDSRVDHKATIRWAPRYPETGPQPVEWHPAGAASSRTGVRPRRERPPSRPRYSLFRQPGHLHNCEVDGTGGNARQAPGRCVTTSDASRGRLANRTRRQCRRDLDTVAAQPTRPAATAAASLCRVPRNAVNTRAGNCRTRMPS